MRVVPVLDLKGGVAVHAIRGERHAYAPVQSVLSPSSEPVALARAFQERLGCDACYVADLDAIAGTGDHAALQIEHRHDAHRGREDSTPTSRRPSDRTSVNTETGGAR